MIIMLRVTVEYFDTHVTLKLEGKLKGSWVDELERCWQTLTSTVPNKPVRVELTSVGFVASEGRELIGKMAAAGAELIASGPMVKAIVDEACAANKRATSPKSAA
jgi:hypothetical protein